MRPTPGTILLAAIGVGLLLLVPSMAAGVQGDRYFLSVTETESPTDGDIRPYSELSPDVQTAFNQARQDGTTTLREHPDREAITTLQNIDYVQVDSAYYRTSLRTEVNDSTLGAFLDRIILAPTLLLGGFLLGYAVVTSKTQDWQPHRPASVGQLIGISWLCSALGTVTSIYLTTGTVLFEQTWLFLTYTGVYTIALVPLLTGGALRRRNWPLAGMTTLPLFAVGIYGVFDSFAYFILGVSLCIGAVTLQVGYVLTDHEN